MVTALVTVAGDAHEQAGNAPPQHRRANTTHLDALAHAAAKADGGHRKSGRPPGITIPIQAHEFIQVLKLRGLQ